VGSRVGAEVMKSMDQEKDPEGTTEVKSQDLSGCELHACKVEAIAGVDGKGECGIQ
jgi:hypothetical protein